MYRDHNCGELTIKNVGEKVTIAGWVQRIRNLGSMIFIDLRDQFGITQIVVSADNKEKLGKCGFRMRYSSSWNSSRKK